jgi:AraC-like DNA-binding protein
MAHFRQFAFKKFGYLHFHLNLTLQLSKHDFKDFIKVAFVKAGGHAIIDFKEYHLQKDTFFFINMGQYYWFDDSASSGIMLYYNRDFYCVEIHDKEVACDGILFHNVYDVPAVLMDENSSNELQSILQQIKIEIEQDDSGIEEMLRILLKQIIIKCTRLWKQAHHVAGELARPEVEFSRSFSQLVEWHYTRYHSVADYAALLHITPKALNKRITRNSNTTPNDLIKNRIILEAKRLLVHTQLSIKEISYKLGYDDTSYFTRFFTKQTKVAPQSFKAQYNSEHP